MPPKRKGKAKKDVEKTTREKEEAGGLIPPAPETQKENETQHQDQDVPEDDNLSQTGDSQTTSQTNEDSNTAGKTPSQTNSESETTGKRKRELLVLDWKVEDGLVEWIRIHPIFYDKSRKDYKDTKQKTRLWQQKADELDNSAKDLEEWYRGMRTRFGRLSKTVSGQGAKELTERDKWIGRVFKFFSKHIVRIPSRQGCSLKQQLATHQDGDSSCELSDEEEDPKGTTASDHSPLLTDLTKRSKKSSKFVKPSPTSAAAKDILKRLEDRIESSSNLQTKISSMVESTEGGMSPRASWGQWMTSMMRDIHEDLWDDFTEKSFTLVSSFRKESKKLSKPQVPAQSNTRNPAQLQPYPLSQSTLSCFPEQQFQDSHLHPQQQQQFQAHQFPPQQYTQQRLHAQQLPGSSFAQQQQQHVPTGPSQFVHTGASSTQSVAPQSSQTSSLPSTSNVSVLTDFRFSGVPRADTPNPWSMDDNDSD